MAWQGSFEFLLALDSFWNIDLFGSGFYFVQLSIAHFEGNKDNDAVVFATLTQLLPMAISTDTEIATFSNNSFLSESCMLVEERRVRSQIFPVRYASEIIPLNNMYAFRIDLPADRDYQSIEFTLIATLHHASTQAYDIDAYTHAKFEKVSQFRAVLRQASKGLHEFVSITFDKDHCCEVQASVHSLLANFVFRQPSMVNTNNYYQNKEISMQMMRIDEERYRQKRKKSLSFFDLIFDDTEEIQKQSEYSTEISRGQLSNSEKYYSFIHFLRKITFGCKIIIFIKMYETAKQKGQFNDIWYFCSLVQKASTIGFIEFYVKHLQRMCQQLNKTIEDWKSKGEGQGGASVFSYEDTQLSQQKQQDICDYQKEEKQDCYLTEQEQWSWMNQVKDDIQEHSRQLYNLWGEFIEIVTLKHIEMTKKYRSQTNSKLKKKWKEFIFNRVLEVKHKQDQSPRIVNQSMIITNTPTTSPSMSSFSSQSPSLSFDNQPNMSQPICDLEIVSDLFAQPDISHVKLNHDLAQRLRLDRHARNPQILLVEDTRMFPNYKTQPIFFTEIHTENVKDVYRDITLGESQERQESQGDGHVLILCHGFQGHSCDLRLIRNALLRAYPKALCLSSKFNEGITDSDISSLGRNLATEIRGFIARQQQHSNITKISFICHSMGGIIARAALQYLDNEDSHITEKLYSYISISTPHLGCASQSNKLIDAGIKGKGIITTPGMWLMQKIHKSQSLLQLQQRDTTDFEESFLYKLSKAQRGIHSFKQVMFISSNDDQYVTQESAFVLKSKKDGNQNRMLENISDGFKSKSIYRVDVSFELQHSIDKMIGRAAHIHFLDSENFANMLAQSYPQFFE